MSSRTLRERAVTSRGEKFLANPTLKQALESLAQLAKSELSGSDADHVFAVIRDGVAIMAAKEHETWLVNQRLHISGKLAEDNKGGSTNGSKEKGCYLQAH